MTTFYGVDYVTCIDEQGKRCMFPVTITDLYAAYGDLGEVGCVMTIDEILSLKELVDNIAQSREM